MNRETELRIEKIKQRTGNVLKYAVVIFSCALALYPFLWVILSSFKDNQEIYMNSMGFPQVWRLDNYVRIFHSPSLLIGYRNSIIITFSVMAITLLIGSMGAYVIARKMKGTAIYTYFTMGIMIPMTSILIPSFLILTKMKLVGTMFGIIIAYAASQMSITIFILVGFMKGIPLELEEAAIIDGCSSSRTFFSIIFPLSKPGIATAMTLVFLYCWNDYLYALIIGGSGNLRTLIVAITYFKTEFKTEYGPICAGLIFSIIPITIAYGLLQEQVIKGLAEGAIKA